MAAAGPGGPIPVWHEYGEAGAEANQGQQQQQQQQAAQPPLGSSAARDWLAAVARRCESAEGAQAKAALNELLRCGSRARDKVVAVANRARQAIGTDRVVEQMVQGADLQLGLVNACVEVVNYAHLRSREHAFPWATLQLGRLHYALELWQVGGSWGCDWVCDFTEKGIVGAEGAVPGIPEEVAEYLAAIQVRVEEELAFIDSSSIFGRIVAVGATWHQDASSDEVADSPAGGKARPARRRSTVVRPGGDAALVARFLSNLARTAMMRTSSVMMDEWPQLRTACPELGARACIVADLLLAEHLELLFGQHVSVAIACAIYYTLRLHDQRLPFRKLTTLMAEVLPNHDEQTFARVELPPLDGSGWDGSRDYGDTRAWYNQIFLNAFSEYDPSTLFGDDEGLAPTPSKAALEAPLVEPRLPEATAKPAAPRLLDATAKPAASLAAAGGAALAAAGWGGAASGGSKAQKGQPRKPLGKLDNKGNSGKGSVLRAR
ncbi:retinoblastoma-associated -like [Chlorella sorokiniana]|uniref:Retinoblastoma-associated-like n=1 Tax=Chlorella sorokiniana TaxID=3076 RepID=A0A2P6TFU4_CHLSO|nr:retinoblastoma-associated -like [Chlorella sorokiniana]|eukprot:PRW32980.1 retinoblastoma-associated -like [Chlorella sorokiniana]